jgi:hypothetical protein
VRTVIAPPQPSPVPCAATITVDQKRKLLTHFGFRGFLQSKARQWRTDVQHIQLEEQTSVLEAKLKSFPHLEIEGSGMEAQSMKNWFRLRDQKSGKTIKVRVMRSREFLTAKFERLLTCFADECRQFSGH